MELFTSRYGFHEGIRLSGLTPVGITRLTPRFFHGGDLTMLKLLAPDDDVWAEHDHWPVFANLYLRQLRRQGMFERVEDALEAIAGRDGRLVLLGFDNVHEPATHCHRRLFALWWLERAGQVVDELPETIPEIVREDQRSLF